MKEKIKLLIKKLSHSKLEPLCIFIFNAVSKMEYIILNFIWGIKNTHKESCEDIQLVENNITFIYKSFERQKSAKKLYNNIRHYYPTAKIIIADDSRTPLKIEGDSNLTIIQMPFNSGLSKGLNRAIENVHTPYVMRMDDDEQLTNATNLADELKFLINNENVDLTGFLFTCPPKCKNAKQHIAEYTKFNMSNVPKPLIIPHMTKIDDSHIVMGKVPNIWLARTDKIKKIAWDDNIRIIDHHEFFYRCAGNIVSTLSTKSIIWHCHNPFNKHYHAYRSNYKNDGIYIYHKHGKQYCIK